MATVKRYRVKCKYIKFKGVTYQAGELLPETFTEREKFRNIYPSRIELVDVVESDKNEGSIEDPPIAPITPPAAPPEAKVNDNTSKEIIPPINTKQGLKTAAVKSPTGLKQPTPLVRTPLTQGAQKKA